MANSNIKRKKWFYGNRASPGTTLDNMLVIKKIFDHKKLVTFNDMKKATGKKWVRGFFNALKTVRKVKAVRKGRKIIGYSYDHVAMRKGRRRVAAKPPANENSETTTARKAA